MGVCFFPGIWKTLAIIGLWPKAALMTRRDDQTEQSTESGQARSPETLQRLMRFWGQQSLTDTNVTLVIHTGVFRERRVSYHHQNFTSGSRFCPESSLCNSTELVGSPSYGTIWPNQCPLSVIYLTHCNSTMFCMYMYFYFENMMRIIFIDWLIFILTIVSIILWIYRGFRIWKHKAVICKNRTHPSFPIYMLLTTETSKS